MCTPVINQKWLSFTQIIEKLLDADKYSAYLLHMDIDELTITWSVYDNMNLLAQT